MYQRKDSSKEVNRTLRIMLFSLRAAYISIIAFLLISPFVLLLDPVYQKPILIFAQDKSLSIANLTDSTELNAIISSEEAFLEKCGDDFDVHYFNFGEAVTSNDLGASFDQRITDYSSLFNEVKDRFENRNVALMIMASDGLYNRGENPMYTLNYLPFPLYTLAIGDTSSQKDSYIDRIDHNELAFYGNTFDVDVTIGSQLLTNGETEISILKNGKEVTSENVYINSANFFETYRFSLKAETVGLEKYEVLIKPLAQEVSITNNRRYFYIEVLEGQQQVLILSAAPHPDVNALMQAINGSKHFKAESKLIRDFDGNVDKYNLLILNQLPSDYGKKSSFAIGKLELPVLTIIGKKTSLNKVNQLEYGVSFERFKRKYNESTNSINADFKIFSISEDMTNLMQAFPPLISPFADYRLAVDMSILSFQKIGKIVTEYPQIGFVDGANGKRGFIFGEGLWRWRLHEYKLTKSTALFDGFVQSMIQYLGLKEDKSRFRVEAKAAYFEDEEVIIQAEYYNKTYELTNDLDATLTITNAEGSVFEYDFLSFNTKYRSNIGRLENGNYTWVAKIDDGIEAFEKSGSFSVKKLELEYSAVRANYPFLVNLSAKFGGRVLSASGLDQLANELLINEKFKPTIHYSKSMKELISFKWLFLLLLVFLSAEWFIRKWIGLI